ncbi:protein kinase [filamentous cyanobacterium CCP5]|nr:protein kinase [filamentous cyanobacterium CCP5]
MCRPHRADFSLANVHPLLDAARLLYDLQRVSEIAQSLSGNLNPDAVARQLTDALVDRFGCAFARIWLVESDRTSLRLVASSGLYTHTDGSFARVPMGAYKVGKIAQNQVPFLSNNLPEESWVKDRQWALDNQIQGFAGYPLAAEKRVLGVLAAFSHRPFAPEFLEVMQVICMTLTVALDAALQAGQTSRLQEARPLEDLPLSDRIAAILGDTRPMLVGTERPLPVSLVYGILRTAELLQQLACSYCRLTYGDRSVLLEAIVSQSPDWSDPDLLDSRPEQAHRRSTLMDLTAFSTYLGGNLQCQPVTGGQAGQISLELPYTSADPALTVQVQCRSGLLQQAFIRLAHQAGLTVSDVAAVRITDTASDLDSPPILWIRHDGRPVPEGAAAAVDLSVTADQLYEQVKGIITGDLIAIAPCPGLSSREQQVMQLLAEGKRDRDIAQELYISESTVKFHINNSLTKLSAKNRYQGVYQATLRGWI